MIIVRLIGGLGNQLFQYAAGRRLAELRCVPLKLDISGFEKYKLHKYSLSHFKIAEDFATEAETARSGAAAGPAGRAVSSLKRLLGLGTKMISERHYHFDPSVLQAPADACLDGYWQSEKYFRDVEPLIRSEFAVKTPPDAANAATAAEIAGCEAASLHVRRGDFVSDETTNSIHGSLNSDYYGRAMALLAGKYPGTRFFVFTDDPEWAAKELPAGWPLTLVTNNKADRNYEDLRLMSLCRHNIIANSTFSWWGAWLNANPAKTVIAPANWFRDGKYDTSDLIPEGWLRI